jgi:hypothetical protein
LAAIEAEEPIATPSRTVRKQVVRYGPR